MMRISYGRCAVCRVEFPVQKWFDNLPVEDSKVFMWVCPGCGEEQHANNIQIRVEDIPPEFTGVAL